MRRQHRELDAGAFRYLREGELPLDLGSHLPLQFVDSLSARMLWRFDEYRKTKVMPVIRELADVIQEHQSLAGHLRKECPGTTQAQMSGGGRVKQVYAERSQLPSQRAIDNLFARVQGANKSVKVSVQLIDYSVPLEVCGPRQVEEAPAQAQRAGDGGG